MITIDWDSNIYTQQRAVLRISGISMPVNEILIKLSGDLSSISARYKLSYDGNSAAIDIDMTDIVRLSNSGTFYVLFDKDGEHTGSPATCTWSNAGLIDPNLDIIPDFYCRGGDWAAVDCIIAPPEMILIGNMHFGNVMVEMIANSDAVVVITLNNGQTISNAFDYQTGLITIPYNAASLLVRNLLDEEDLGKTCRLKRENDTNFVCVRWTSRYGRQKVMWWELRNAKRSVTSAVEIATVSKEPDVRKGYELSALLHMSELSAYDYWYYADIITSNSVEVRCMQNPNIWYKAEVITKDYTIPNTSAGKLNDLNVEVILKQYDAI